MVVFNRIMEEVVHEGYLVKSPPEKRLLKAKWRQRWFVLRHSGHLPGQYVLEYFADNSCRKLKGKIDLDQCVQVQVAVTFEIKKVSSQYMFNIITPKRVYNLVAESEEDMNKWVDCICSVLGLKLCVDQEYITPQEASANAVASVNSVVPFLPIASVPASGNVTRSSSNPYIPISECHTGKPLSENNDSNKSKINDATTIVPLPLAKEPQSSHNFPSEFYDIPRPLGNNLIEMTINDENYSVPNGCSTLPPRVNWKTHPCEITTPQFGTVPRKESIDKTDCGTYDIVPSLHSVNHHVPNFNRDVEELNNKLEKTSVKESEKNSSNTKEHKSNEAFVAPPRPPKPSKLRHDYENFELHHLISKSDNMLVYDVPPPAKSVAKSTLVQSNMRKESIDELTPSTQVPLLSSSGSENVMDDMYDFPKFRSENNINTLMPPAQPQVSGMSTRQRRQHAYNNVAPGLFNSKELIFNYEYRPSLTSDYINMDTTKPDVYVLPDSSQSASCGAYANVPSSPSQLNSLSLKNDAPPVLNRSLKPKRSDKNSFSFNLQPPPLYRSKANKHSFSKPEDKFLGQTLSSSSLQSGLNGTPPVPNRFRQHQDMLAASEDDLSSSGGSRRNSSNDDQARYFACIPAKKDEIQYLDLDLDSEPSPSPKSPERVSATVYKKVDFVKTKAFNDMRQTVEATYRKSQ